jgi:hypothetical protein
MQIDGFNTRGFLAKQIQSCSNFFYNLLHLSGPEWVSGKSLEMKEKRREETDC